MKGYWIERFIRLLLWIGFIRRDINLKIRWPFSAPPYYKSEGLKGWLYRCKCHGPFYLFRNLPHVVKWEEGRLLPRRWGFGIFGFEFGDRG